MTNKLSFEIEVIDTGKIKIKQFAEATRKAVEDIRKTTDDLSSTSASLRDQFERLFSTVRTKKAFEELSSSVERAQAAVAGLGPLIEWIKKILWEIAGWYGVYKLLDDAYSGIEKAIIGTSRFEEELGKLQDRLEKLHTSAKVLEFLEEQQSLAEQQAEQLSSTTELLDRLTKVREALLASVGNRPLLLPGDVRRQMHDWGIMIENLKEEADKLSQSLMAKTKIIVGAAAQYDEMTSPVKGLKDELEELRNELEKVRQKYEELEHKFKGRETLDILQERIRAEERTIQAIYGEIEIAGERERLGKERINTLNLQIQAEDAATQAIYDGGQALEELQRQYEANLTRMNDFRELTGDVNQDAELFMNLQGDIVELFKKQGEAIEALDQKQKEWNKTNLQSVNVFASMFDLLGALSNLLTQFGIRIGGFFQRFLGSVSAIRQFTRALGQIREAGATLAKPLWTFSGRLRAR